MCSGTNLELVRSLGAEEVIDYTVSDFTRRGETYGVIFDAVGKLSRAKTKGALKETGKYLNVLRDAGTSMKVDAADLLWSAIGFEAGELRTVIDWTYRLEDIVEAHRYVDTGRKRGNVVVTVAAADPAPGGGG